VSGIITRWRFRAGCCTAAQTGPRTMTLKTFRPGAQGSLYPQYAWIVPLLTGPSFVIPAGNEVASDPYVELPARLPIAPGERVGIVADHPIDFAVYHPSAGVTSTVAVNGVVSGGEAYGNPMFNTAMAISVDVEPDADGDGFGDESQDCAPADPATQGTCPTNPPIYLAPVYKEGPCEGICGRRRPRVQRPDRRGAEQHRRGVRPARKTLAHVRYSIQPGKTKTLRVKLSKAGRRLLKQKGKLKVVLTVRPDDGDAKSVRRTLKWRGAGG
jgi:hypothetical protein